MKKIIKIILLLTLSFSVLIKEVIASEKIKIGLLVPLTGKNSEIGQSIIKSTRLAINKINDSSIEIVPRDTKSSPADTLRAAKEHKELGIKIIIGPVFNENKAYTQWLTIFQSKERTNHCDSKNQKKFDKQPNTAHLDTSVNIMMDIIVTFGYLVHKNSVIFFAQIKKVLRFRSLQL